MRLNIYMALQLKEIEEHKYYLSQEMGADVGLNYAVAHWNKTPMKGYKKKTHAERFREDFIKNEAEIYAMCTKYCNNNCSMENCSLPKGKLHEILKDW